MKPTKTFGILGQRVGRALASFTPPGPLTYNQPDDLEMTDLGRSYGTYSAFHAQGWTDEQMVEHGYAVRNGEFKPEYTPETMEAFRQTIERWCKEARRMGIVITIEQVSDYPPAMGKHHDVVTVREVRK